MKLKSRQTKPHKPKHVKYVPKSRLRAETITRMSVEVDILENDLRKQYPEVLEILLFDQTTRKNIFWGTDNYNHLGKGYEYNSQILPELITGVHGYVIMPRISKGKALQHSRARDMAEVFTPSWICNAQNNLIDNAWFGRKNIFNKELIDRNGTHIWKSNNNIIRFPKGKSWQDYVKNTRLEITCGEAPYITSRYDTTTGIFITVENRIGQLDRKLRIINENVEKKKEWQEAVKTAFKNVYAYEWHGDSLLLARESMLITFIENHRYKFHKNPPLSSIKKIANIISWNVWQMDGLKGVIPNSCFDKEEEISTLFPENKNTEIIRCVGCSKNNVLKHNGIYCEIMDWSGRKKIKFISLFK